MTSERKTASNRANAKKSTGPTTAEGKAISRNNAYKHGMRSRSVVMPDEDRSEYEAMRDEIAREFGPETDDQRYQVKQMADARWCLERLKGIEAALYSAEIVDPEEIERISRWQVRAGNAYYKALKHLRESLKAAAETPVPSPPSKPRVPTGWIDPETGEITPFDYYPEENNSGGPQSPVPSPQPRE